MQTFSVSFEYLNKDANSVHDVIRVQAETEADAIREVQRRFTVMVIRSVWLVDEQRRLQPIQPSSNP